MNKKMEKLMDWPAIEGVLYAEQDNPHSVLGAKVVGGQVLVTCFFPDALSVKIHIEVTGEKLAMEKVEKEGFFAVLLKRKTIPSYHYEVSYEKGTSVGMVEIYNTPRLISQSECKRFHGGVNDTVYEKLGAHPITVKGVQGILFAVWAPNAASVSVVGDFNLWDGRRHLMRRLEQSGIFELFIPELEAGEIYKYEVRKKNGDAILKADPYGYYAEKRPHTASIVWDIEKYSWNDDTWIEERKDREETEPMMIYEIQLGSFLKSASDEPKESFYNYRELAVKVSEYCLSMGYTHVELMPIMEYPYDGSWGYQVTGYYAPTSRYGTPEDFMYFVDTLHKNGLGVILDWVPAHFPKDAHGLAQFDGTCLYEHLDKRQGEHPHWGTLIYNYGRPEVANFLIANALFWLEKYHIDGLRLDAVASMLYLDYGKKDGEWIANMYGGNENLEAMELLKRLNTVVHKKYKGVMMIAEESTAWPKVTGNVSDGGLGFDYKWNMGWMNDFLDYMRTDPLFRKGKHGQLTFSMIYHYSENFILVLSHDEVVHEKGSMYEKMPGEEQNKFANLRIAYGFMAAHPGKKLIFMGQDFGQRSEWNEEMSLDWGCIKPDNEHGKLQTYVKELNDFYKKHPAMYEKDTETDGFQWLSSLDADHSVITFLRKSREETLLIVCNFTPVSYEKFRVGVPFDGKYKELLNSDKESYGGMDVVNPRVKKSKPEKWDGQKNSIEIRLPALGISIFKCMRNGD